MDDQQEDWVDGVNKRGLGGVLETLLDIAAPFGTLGAQLLWVAQPVSGLLGWHAIVGEVARVLEDPDEIERVRQRLNVPPPESP